MENNEHLKREIGVQGLAAGIVNFIVGAGIFALPALVAVYLGSASVLAYLVCGTLILMIMLCFAEMGSQVTVTGGPYAYIQAAFGPYIGFLANVLFWFGYCVIADAAIANAMVDMLAIKIPIFSKELYRALFFLVMFGTFAAINIIGVKHGVRLVKMLTLVKLIPLVGLVLIGVFWIKPENLAFTDFPTIESLGQASILLFFAFGGGEGALSTSGEIRHPQWTVPRGVLLGVGSVILLYLSIQIVCQGVVGADLVNYKEAPLAEVATRIVGPAGGALLVFAAAISIFGNLSGSIMQYPRILYAGSREGVVPAFLAKVHPEYATPVVAIIVYTLLDLTFSIFGGFQQLAILSSAALLLTYLGVVLATIKFRMNKEEAGSEVFRVPGGLAVPLLSVGVIGWFLYQLSGQEWMAVGIFFGVLTVIFLVMQAVKKKT